MDNGHYLGSADIPADVTPSPEELARIKHFLRTIHRSPTFSEMLADREKEDRREQRRKQRNGYRRGY